MNNFMLIQLTFAFLPEQIVCPERHEEFYPFLVKIEAKGKALDCAGTILTPCTVLTSAHCIEGVEPSQVAVSQITTKVTKYNVTSTVIHPKYSRTVLANDIALLQVNKIFQQPWGSATLNNLAEETIFPKCDTFQILGWSGHIIKDSDSNGSVLGSSEKPMKAVIKLIPNSNCSAAFENFGGVFQGEEKLCGVTAGEGEEEGCFTGPGGPLLCSLYSRIPKKTAPKKKTEFEEFEIDKKGILADPIDLLVNFRKSDEGKFKREVENDVKNLQVGVVSWGKSCSKVPSVYIKTDVYYDWIVDTARKMSYLCSGFDNFKSITPVISRAAIFRCSTAINFLTLPVYITVLLKFV